MKHPIQDMPHRAFTLVETLLMLCALAVFSLTSLAVLKKDDYSVKVILSKLNQSPGVKLPDITITTPPPASASNTAARAKVDMPASTLALPPVVPSPAPPVPVPAPAPKSAPAGSPAPTPDSESKAAPGTAN